MLDLNEKLTIIFHNKTTGDYENKTLYLNQFKEEYSHSVNFDNNIDLYIGFKKPIKNFYVHLSTPLESPIEILFEHSTQNGMQTIKDVYDETHGFSKSGFIQYKELGSSNFTVADIKCYWVKISTASTDENELSFCAINMLLNSIYDLSAKYPQIIQEDFFLGKASLHVAIENARNEVLSKIIRKGLTAESDARLTVFDLLDVQEIREAATFLTLANIFEMVSDNADDKFSRLSKSFFKKFEASFNLYSLTIDKNQSGDGASQNFQVKCARLLR